jgi:hypothetical protein
MELANRELINMLNNALNAEHAARLQCLSRADFITGYPRRVCDAQNDQAGLIESLGTDAPYSDEFVYSDLSEGNRTFEGDDDEEIRRILEINMRDEENVIELYRKIQKTILDNKKILSSICETLEQDLRLIKESNEILVDQADQLSGFCPV